MRFLRRLLAFALYAAVLLPMNDYRLNAWMKAVEVTSTSLHPALRRRKSSVENDRMARFLKLMNDLGGDEDVTWRWRA